MKACVFAGTFDPISNGHIAIIKKLIKDYKKVLIVVGENSKKAPLFSLEQRLNLVKIALKGIKGVRIISYIEHKENYREYLSKNGIKYYARGIRNQTDLEYEKKAEEINEKLYPEIKTVYYNASKKHEKISSTTIRERIENGKDFKRLVPKKAYLTIKSYIKNIK